MASATVQDQCNLLNDVFKRMTIASLECVSLCTAITPFMNLNKTIAGYKPVGLYMTTAVYGYEHDQCRLYTSGLGRGQYMYTRTGTWQLQI